jgi:TP901 family phage tail tape measure protein
MAQGRDQIIVDVLGNTKPLEKNISKVANQALTLNTKNFSQPLGKITGQLGEFEKSLAASNARVIAFGASAGAIYAVQRAFEATIRTVIDVEKSLADINVILNVSQKTLTSFGNSLFDIAKNTGLSFSEVAKAATEFSRQGLGIEDTLKRTSDALILTRLSGLDTVSSVEALTAAINSFSNSALTSTEIVNKLAAVDAAFAVSSADLAEAIKRVGSSADDVGVSFDQLIGLVTSAQQITSRGGSVIGNSFKTIFTRLQRPKTLEALEQIGVATKDQEGNILPLVQILNSLSQTYDKLSSVQKAQIAETVGGVFQINILKAALGDLSKEYSIYSRALGISSGATDEATRRNEILNQTLAATINKTVVNLQNAATDIGNLALAPALQRALGGLNYVLENFGTDESEGIGTKIGEGLARGLGNFLSGPGLLIGVAALIKIFERLTVFTADAFKQLTGLNTQTAEQRSLQAQILNLIGRNPQIIQQINSGNLDTANLHKQILSLIEQETVAMQRQVSIADSLTKSLMAAGVRIPQTGPMRGTAVRTKSFGFVPNFSANQEIMGAFAGGYMPGQVKKMVIPNYGAVTYNSAEKVKRFNGMNQPAIMPPQESLAGKNYKKNFEAAHGFNPYANKGFIPNFATLLGNPYEQNYVKLQGELKNIASYGSAGISISRIGKALGVVRGPEGNFYVPFNNYEKLLKASKQDLEKNAAGRGKRFEGKIEPYALVYPSFGMSNPFPSAGRAGGKSIGFDVVPFPGNIKGQSTNIIGPSLYKKSLKALVDNASEFLVNLAGVDPDVINDQKFKNYLYSNISQDQIGTLVGNAFEGGILASLNIVPNDRSRILDLSREEIKKLGETFKISSLTSGKYLGGDFKNALSPFNLDSMAGKILNTRLNKNFGFIPNFSPINKAFQTEKSLGGSPVLDYQSGVGLYVRDSKRQPNFAAVKRDHPEGLSKAISNSYAMQKGMAAFGFVPNFVRLPETIPTAQAEMLKAGVLRGGFTEDIAMRELTQEQEQLTETTRKTRFDLDKFREKAIFASFGLSIAGSFFSEVAGENEALKKNINNFSQGLSTALTAVSLLPGPIGLAVGGVTALYSAAVFLAKTFRDNGEDITKNFERVKEENTNFTNATSTYSQTLQKLNDAYSSAKTPIETIVKLNEDLAKAAMDLPEKYRLQLLSITDNTKLQDEINRIQGSLAREQRNLEFATSVNAKLQEGAFSAPRVFQTGGALRGATREIFGGFSERGQIKFLRDINSEFLKLNQPDLINFLEKSYGLNRDIADVLSRTNPQEFKDLTTGLFLYIEGLKRSQNEFKATEDLRKEEAKTQKALERQTLKAKLALDTLNDSLVTLVNASVRSEAFRQNFGNTRGANARETQISRAGGLLDLAELFTSQEYVTGTRGRLAELSALETYGTQAREITSSTRQSILEIGSNLLRDLRRPGQEEPQARGLIESFESKLLDISKQNISANETAEKLNEAIGSIFGSSFDRSTEVQSKVQDEVRQQNEKLALLSEEQKKSNEIARSNLSIQQKILQARRDIETFGGVQGFLDPESLKSSFDNFQRSLNLFRSGRSNLAERGRGAAGLLSETIRFAGGSIGPGLDRGLGSLRAAAITGRASELRSQARGLAGQAPLGLKPVFRDIAARSTEIATRQIDNLIKSENIGENVDQIAKLLRSIESAQGTNVIPELNNTIISALQAVQQDLTPSIDDLKLSLDKASQIFTQRETYQNIGAEISRATLTKTGGEFRVTQAETALPNIIKRLQEEFPSAIEGGVPSSRRQFLEQFSPILQRAFSEGRPIGLRELRGENMPAGLRPRIDDKGAFAQLLQEYNNQISIIETSRQSIQASSQALDQLNARATDTAAALLSLGQNVTPIGALAGPQVVQGSVDLNIPNNLLELNVGGNISFDGGRVEVVLSPESDLTTLVTPIVNDFLSQAKRDLQTEFNNQIFKVREEAGLRRQAVPLLER